MLLLLTYQLTVEIIGYCGRAAAVNMTGQLGPYIIQSTFILIPPAFFAATIYMCLGRIIHMVEGDHLSVIRPQIVTKIFVTGDVMSFGVQGSVAGLYVHPNLHTVTTAVVIVGLAIQLISFMIFGLCAVVFHVRIRRRPTACSSRGDLRWIRTLYMLYAVSVLILIRSVFRIIEYAFGNEGYPITHEWTLYCFDSIPMVLVAITFFIFYPSNLAPKLADDAAIQLESRGTGDSAI